MNKRNSIILGCVLTGVVAITVGGLVGVANESGWDHALGKDKTAGAELVLDSTLTVDSAVVVDGHNATQKGFYEDDASNVTAYNYSLVVHGNDKADYTELNPGNQFVNTNEVTYIVSGYSDYIDEIEIKASATAKKDVKAKVYVGNAWLGTETLSAGEDTYKFESTWLRKGDVKIVFTNAESEDTSFALLSITINPAEEEEA